jgi:hypothetical protein
VKVQDEIVSFSILTRSNLQLHSFAAPILSKNSKVDLVEADVVATCDPPTCDSWKESTFECNR